MGQLKTRNYFSKKVLMKTSILETFFPMLIIKRTNFFFKNKFSLQHDICFFTIWWFANWESWTFVWERKHVFVKKKLPSCFSFIFDLFKQYLHRCSFTTNKLKNHLSSILCWLLHTSQRLTTDVVDVGYCPTEKKRLDSIAVLLPTRL